MAKTEVYSWRVAPDLKMALERAARAEGSSVSALLERIARAWLAEHRAVSLRSEEEERIRARAMKCIGVIRGDDPKRSSQVSQRVREILLEKKRRRDRA
jgi:hypothetical protein